MKSTKENIVEFAKNLYLEVDEEGKKKNTLRLISTEIKQKFHKSVDFSTIALWSKKYDWEGIFEKIKMSGIEKAKADNQQKENQLIDEKSQTIADIYKSNKQINSLAKNHLLSRMTGKILKDSEGNEISADISNQDLIRLLQHSEDTILELHNKRKSEDKDNLIVEF